jgi:iron-sulfur cluster assembly accessory protein
MRGLTIGHQGLQSTHVRRYVTGMNAIAPTPVTPFSVSARAARRIAEILAAGGGAALRVAVLAGGCSGFQYKFELDSAPQEDDLVLENEGSRVLVDAVSLDLLAGAELDYTDELMGSHFTVRNPNATSACGCGTSFAID